MEPRDFVFGTVGEAHAEGEEDSVRELGAGAAAVYAATDAWVSMVLHRDLTSLPFLSGVSG